MSDQTKSLTRFQKVREFIFSTFPVLLPFIILISIPVAFATYQYHFKRPPFASAFLLVTWKAPLSATLSNDTVAYVDQHDHVLLVVGIDPRKEGEIGRSTTWAPGGRDGDHLVVRLRDGHTTRIEWRRDCIVVLNDEGVPTYRSVSVTAFRDAISKPYGWTESLNVRHTANELLRRATTPAAPTFEANQRAQHARHLLQVEYSESAGSVGLAIRTDSPPAAPMPA